MEKKRRITYRKDMQSLSNNWLRLPRVPNVGLNMIKQNCKSYLLCNGKNMCMSMEKGNNNNTLSVCVKLGVRWYDGKAVKYKVIYFK